MFYTPIHLFINEITKYFLNETSFFFFLMVPRCSVIKVFKRLQFFKWAGKMLEKIIHFELLQNNENKRIMGHWSNGTFQASSALNIKQAFFNVPRFNYFGTKTSIVSMIHKKQGL
uniref:Uncharacterized protein n=1 Tax=Cacopsylla melanoneura TaxID=428564 RepID=A0A8D8W5J7_9HEMI